MGMSGSGLTAILWLPTVAAAKLGLPRLSAFKRLGSTAGLAAKMSSLAASAWLAMQLKTPAAGVMSPNTLLARHLAVICSKASRSMRRPEESQVYFQY